jgi:membrane fusion protein, type I secretion system
VGNVEGSTAGMLVANDTRGHIISGYATAALLVFGLGGWAMNANLAGAVLAPGTVVVDSNVKKVQHPSGGVVGEILVKDGDRVEAGDLLMRLDETVPRANLGVITSQIDELAARQSRLLAERDERDQVEAPAELRDRLNEPTIDSTMGGELLLFESRRAARVGQKSQLTERIAQLREEINGLEEQHKAKVKEVDLIHKELIEDEKLEANHLMPLSKIMAIRRDAARVEGESAQLVAAAAQSKGKIAETELQIIQIDRDLKTEVMKDLRETQGKLAELSERRIAAEDQLKRVDIRAPQTGIVHQLSVHTVGGVVTQTEPIMLIVPENDSLVVEVKIQPQDIDHVHLGQRSFVRFTAFNQRTTPEVNGTVQRLAADVIKDPQTNQPYFLSRIAIPDIEIKKLKSLKVVPGMPADVQIQTGNRTAMTYFLKPLNDQLAKTFREN